mmetsp:Transcript_33240/g.48839  ORF Transcript_33240/g.48839 Transcript_33240/m.48839 type:complete len:503 (-) Transcript_33240:124-1632(-)|eukprot:CAMPEP_0195519258 /NCGR_PEP_ID=MMETSP0794_2-20130614/14542_1 /TAXON_ID=515487 /ORGANISM="Stephanopyxis turris, Strain CCMP 815" /LENGTH=502 /DNA_ID=CAMNT_0040648381 /DNA_START=211 /DNA_END=1719 /DNA_ORIENTATION=+
MATIHRIYSIQYAPGNLFFISATTIVCQLKLTNKRHFAFFVSNQVLGFPIVLWRDASGALHCVEDKCPHRSVPLSIGQNIGGTLECLYHGWQIDGDSGKVCHIPSSASIPKNARCRIYPVHEQDGVVWVWMGIPPSSSSTTAANKDDNNVTKLFTHPLNKKSVYDKENLPPRDCMVVVDENRALSQDKSFVQQLFCVDLPIDHSLMIENLLDPAHVPFAHEGTIGRRSDARQFRMNMDKFDVVSPNGGKLRGFYGVTDPNLNPNNKEGEHTNSFLAFAEPCHNILHTPLNNKNWDFWQFASCTPTKPGQMRLVYRMYRNWFTFVDKFPPLKRIFAALNRKIIFQDYNLLAGQQQRLWEGANAWNAAVQADCLPMLYRQFWRKTFGANWQGTTQRNNRSTTGDEQEDQNTKKGVWFRGYDKRVLMDIEDLDRVSTAHFDCDGCAAPAVPFHPLNPFQNRNIVGSISKNTYNIEDGGQWKMNLSFLVMGVAGGIALTAVLSRRA